MSAYLSSSDFKQLAIRESALKNIDDPTLTAFITKASGLVDSYLRGQYKLPLKGSLSPSNTFPDEIVSATAAVARYKLLVWRGFSPEGGGDASVLNEYMASIAWLRDVAAGRVQLDIAADQTEAFDGGPIVSTQKDLQGNDRGWFDDDNDSS